MVYRRPVQLERNKTTYCSRECYDKDRGVFRTERLCERCGNSYFPNHRDQRFCSRKCANTLRRLGKPHRNERGARLDLLKSIFDFDSCMVEGCNYNTCYEVHRLKPGNGHRYRGYEIGNMFAICPNHHAEITRKLITVVKINDQTLRID